jgi:2-polyprenyl-6-methoxyphenol hydroxylase-like FAD-dependent oxidoreductase
MPTRVYDYPGAPKVDFDDHVYYGEPVLKDRYEIVPGEGDGRSVLISGGSMGGLFTALALREGGHDVTVFERSPRGGMESQGAGIIAHPEMLDWLDRRGIADRDAISTSTDRIQYLDDDDEVVHERDDTIYTTSWDTVYRKLRETLGRERYRMGHHVTGVESGDGSVEMTFEDAPSRTGDLAVVAEGYRSGVRGQLLPDVELEYAGYIAWRGTVPEGELPADLFEQFAENYTFYHAPDSQILSYPVPGPDGELTPGERRTNWVWYYNVPEDELESYLRSTGDRSSRYSVAPGTMHPSVRETLGSLAEETLPSSFTRLVAASDEPFIQSVHDLVVPRMVFDRTCIIGDAAAFVRPHMAAGTAKAAADGFALAEALTRYPDDLQAALSDWEASQLATGSWLVAKARHRGDIYTGRR